MPTNDVKCLWGHDFRVVPKGLDETDVVDYVESLRALYEGSQKEFNHAQSLRELATITLEKAQRLGEEIRRKAEKESKRQAKNIISEAEDNARRITEKAAEDAVSIKAEARKKAHDRITEVWAAMLPMKTWALEEFQALKERGERMESFLSSFETFLNLLESELDRKVPDVVDEPTNTASDDQARMLAPKKDTGPNNWVI
ncbi:MAG: DivIVA domain-containing protein [Dehalococcoidia bacterium]